jgi:hypothetical protein
MNTKEQITEMQRLMEVIVTKQSSEARSKFKDHNEARKAASELKKLAGAFKKTSGDEDKAAKAVVKAAKSKTKK